jgi:uncharacterized protein YaaR (DUF327 family)
MNKIVKIIMSTLVGAGCFSAGLYYATLEFEETLDNVMGEYEVISDKVNTFVDVTNPETVQAYTTELRRILDDIKFLHTLIETGQLADEKLDEYLASQQSNVDVLKESLTSITTDVSSMLDSSHTHIHGMVEELEGNVKSLLSENIDKQKQSIQDLNTQLTELHIKLNEVNKVIDKIKNSKLSKYLK